MQALDHRCWEDVETAPARYTEWGKILQQPTRRNIARWFLWRRLTERCIGSWDTFAGCTWTPLDMTRTAGMILGHPCLASQFRRVQLCGPLLLSSSLKLCQPWSDSKTDFGIKIWNQDAARIHYTLCKIFLYFSTATLHPRHKTTAFAKRGTFGSFHYERAFCPNEFAQCEPEGSGHWIRHSAGRCVECQSVRGFAARLKTWNSTEYLNVQKQLESEKGNRKKEK